MTTGRFRHDDLPPARPRALRPHLRAHATPSAVAAVCAAALLALAAGAARAQAQVAAGPADMQAQMQARQQAQAALEALPRPATPPPERGPVVPAQVERWRNEARALEHGDGGVARDPVRAAELYCRAARHGDAESQYSLAWMLTNSRGIERDEPQAAHLFAAAAEQGHEQARNVAARMGEPRGAPPACLRPPEEDRAEAVASRTPQLQSQPQRGAAGRKPGALQIGRADDPRRTRLVLPPTGPLLVPPPPPNAPEPLVRYVNLVAPDYRLQPHLVLAFIATESNFDAAAVSPKNAQGLMQLLPDTAARFGVRNLKDPVQNLKAGMSYLRWLMAYFQGDIGLVAAAYNAGERAVERYLGVPPYAETRMYVRKIKAGIGGQAWHPYDAAITRPSERLTAMRPAAPTPTMPTSPASPQPASTR